MEKHYILALLFAAASAAAIATSNASYAYLQQPRENAGSARFDAGHHQTPITKRGVYSLSLSPSLVSTPNQKAKAPRTLTYCWEHVGHALSETKEWIREALNETRTRLETVRFSESNETHMEWIREALNETWNRLDVVRFSDEGFCSTDPFTQSKTGPSTIRVALLDQSCGYSMFHPPGNAIFLQVGFTPICAPDCTANTHSKKACIKNIAVHEFGHSLGLLHEQHRIDTPTVYNDNPCTMDTLDLATKTLFQNLLRPIGPWDKDSVMNFCSPGFSNFTNYRPLSLGDRSAILSLYGQTAYFNSSCTSRNFRQHPFSPACQSAVQKFCEKALGGTHAGVIGVLRNVTTHGLNVTCFMADFIQRREQKRENVALKSFVRPASETKVDAYTICHKWEGTLGPETYIKKRFVGFSLDIGEDQPVIVCKESLWHSTLGGSDILELSRKLNDFDCRKQLPDLKFTGNGHYPLSCIALVDSYCEIHYHGAAGIILPFDEKTNAMEIVCFQPILKIELFSYLD